MKQYYIQLFSPHGLIRQYEPEIGKDKDTGGQVKFVLELMEALSQHPQVRKVDLFTRKIADKNVSPLYNQQIETINNKARIVRINCGGKNYRLKETLWPYLDEFVDNTLHFIKQENDVPDAVHGHYADGNYIAGCLARMLHRPQLATAHSLGRNKQQLLLQQGMTQETIDKKFNMQRRIAEEEKYLKTADLIFVGTRYVLETQYGLYENKSFGKFAVVPPGFNTEVFFPFYRQDMPSFKPSVEQEQALYRIHSEIDRFLFQPSKPLILSIGRPDVRKNFETIIQAYGEDKELQAIANLAIFAGVRKDISLMPEDEKEILTNLLLLLDKYDLYGKMAIPKKNDPQLEVPEIYRLAARKKGVFVNGTPAENFGLTVLEAAGCGLPVIASSLGGPKEILEHCQNGFSIDVENTAQMAAAIKKIVADQQQWETFSCNGIREAAIQFSWTAHVRKYIEELNRISSQQNLPLATENSDLEKMIKKAKLFIITDLDGTLITGNTAPGLDDLKQWLKEQGDNVLFGVASGRNKQLTEAALNYHDLAAFTNVMICSAGTEIYYTQQYLPDRDYDNHINYCWNRENVKAALAHCKLMRLQEEEAQWPFKISYYVNEEFTTADLNSIRQILAEHKLKSKILLTENHCLDILPIRAGKGNAIKHLSQKWQIPLQQFITAGNSGNDIDMLELKAKGIIVANYSPEMEILKDKKQIYFAGQPLAAGVLEGILHHA